MGIQVFHLCLNTGRSGSGREAAAALRLPDNAARGEPGSFCAKATKETDAFTL